MGKDNMLALGWPKEYGGAGFTPTEQLIFFEEALLACAPVPFVTLNTVGPAIMDHGTEDQKKRFYRLLLLVKFIFMGYTEPSAGTDLASLKTSAVKKGNEYIVNGNKSLYKRSRSYRLRFLAARTIQCKKQRHICFVS